MYSKIIIVGKLAFPPEMRYLAGGQAITSLRIAVNRKYKDVEEVTWYRVSVWGKTAESCNQYLDKGSLVLIEGRLQPDEHGGPRVWQDKDGNHRASFEVTAEAVKFLDSKPTHETTDRGAGYEVEDDDGIPF